MLVRPSYVLGGRAMQIVADDGGLVNFMNWALKASPEHPILIDKFLEDAIEVDVDAICDGKDYRHRRHYGAHRGGGHPFRGFGLRAAPLFPVAGDPGGHQGADQGPGRGIGVRRPDEHPVRGERTAQVYVLEVNPRASRTVPFVSKATGVSLAKLATKVMLGHTLKELGFTEEVVPPYFAVKESVFPFRRFPGVDPILGPEMRSTGEVMGIDVDFGLAYAKAQLAAGQVLPLTGGVLFSVKDPDKPLMAPLVKDFKDLGFQVYATRGTAQCLKKQGVEVEEVYKIREARPNIIDRIKNREIALVINTPGAATPRRTPIPSAGRPWNTTSPTPPPWPRPRPPCTPLRP